MKGMFKGSKQAGGETQRKEKTQAQSRTVILDQDTRNFDTLPAGLQSQRVHGRLMTHELQPEVEEDLEEESDMREVIRVLQQ